jgi:hypothetical protein
MGIGFIKCCHLKAQHLQHGARHLGELAMFVLLPMVTVRNCLCQLPVARTCQAIGLIFGARRIDAPRYLPCGPSDDGYGPTFWLGSLLAEP